MSRAQIQKEGLLEYFIAEYPELGKEIASPPMTEEQRKEAMRQFRIENAKKLPLVDLLDIVERRFEEDPQFRSGLRDISRNKGKPDKPGRKGKLSQAETYWQVQLQRHSGLIRRDAIDVVAKHYGKTIRNVQRQYEAEVSRIKKAHAVRQDPV
jgi:hypothetical protein